MNPNLNPQRPRRRALVAGHWVLATTFALIFMTGCGEPESIYDTDEGPIQDLVWSLLDDWNSPSAMEAAFVDGAVPPENVRPDYGKFAYSLVEGSVELTSETEATFQVQFRQPDTGDYIDPPMNWSASKADGTWRLKEAPVPGG